MLIQPFDWNSYFCFIYLPISRIKSFGTPDWMIQRRNYFLLKAYARNKNYLNIFAASEMYF